LYKTSRRNLGEEKKKHIWREKGITNRKEGSKSYTLGFDSVFVIGAWKSSNGSVTDQSWYFAGKSTLDSYKEKT
jgi:hypothetical protein